jgi:hypothetical protein
VFLQLTPEFTSLIIFFTRQIVFILFYESQKLDFWPFFDPFLDPRFWPFLTLFGPPFFGHFWPFFRCQHMQVFVCHSRHSRHLHCLNTNFLRHRRKPRFTPFSFVFWSAGYRKTLSVQIIEVLFEDFSIVVVNVENFSSALDIMKKTRKMSKNRVFPWLADPLGPHRPPDFPVFDPFFDYFLCCSWSSCSSYRMYKIFLYIDCHWCFFTRHKYVVRTRKMIKKSTFRGGVKNRGFWGSRPAPPSTLIRAKKNIFC